MKKFLIILLILLGICTVAAVTCPDKQAHKDAISAVMDEAVREAMISSGEDDGTAAFASLLFRGVIGGPIMDRFLTVKNYYLFNVCLVSSLNGESHVLSVGAFGHVFPVNKESYKDYLTSLYSSFM